MSTDGDGVNGAVEICVPASFNKSGMRVPSGPKEGWKAPNKTGGCWNLVDYATFETNHFCNADAKKCKVSTDGGEVNGATDICAPVSTMNTS